MFIEQSEQINQHFQFFAPWFLLQSAPSSFKEIVPPDANTTWNELLEKAKEFQALVNARQKENNTSDENRWLEIMQAA